MAVRIFYTDHFALPLPAGHRFPMPKYPALRERVQRVVPDLVEVPPAASDETLALAHDPAYVAAVAAGTLDAKAMRRIGFPWSPAMVERSRRSVGATIAACRSALESSRRPGAAPGSVACGINLAGGTHHAFRDRGEGFCVFNDAAVAVRTVQREGLAQRVAIVDLDVHQGNGTAAMLAGDPHVFTFSIHGSRNFPFHKERSDLDIELPDGTGDEDYLGALSEALPGVLSSARPDLVIYLAGADPYEGDRLGRLSLTKGGLARRDRLVLAQCRARSIPVAIAMAGGYAHQIEDVVDIHFATVATALELFANRRVLDSDAPPEQGAPPESRRMER